MSFEGRLFMKKFLLVLMFLFLCTGCQIKYDLQIISEDKINESIYVNKANENHNFDSGVGMDLLSPFEFFFQSLPYDTIGSLSGNYSAKKNYNYLNNYFDESVVFTKIFDSKSVVIENNKVSMNIKLDDKTRKLIAEFGEPESVYINLTIPYKVLHSNATKVINNNYIWKYDELNANSSFELDFILSNNRFKPNIYIISLVFLMFISVCVLIGYMVYTKHIAY